MITTTTLQFVRTTLLGGLVVILPLGPLGRHVLERIPGLPWSAR